MRRTIVMMAAAMAVVGSLAAADLNMPPGKWWENERLSARIGLTAEQRERIDGLVYGHALRMIDLNADVKRAELELANQVDQPGFDPAAVRAAFAAFQKARQALELERFEMLLAVRGVLTAEQWGAIQEMQKELRRRRWSPEGRPEPGTPPAGRRGGPSPGEPGAPPG